MFHDEPFFLLGIVPDVARITHAFAARFLETLVQLILILIQSVPQKQSVAQKALGSYACDACGRKTSQCLF
jgi:hypothetical protein